MTGIGNTGKRRAGQAMIFFIMVLVVMVFFVLWNFDLHRILHVKHVAQNAGDAAALMAARWQGISLNLIGDLNLMQALALGAGDREAADAIANIQARLCYAGPMIAFLASQQAAKNNGTRVHPGFTEITREHAQAVRFDYPFTRGPDGDLLFPEPYPGCWQDYANMLDYAAAEGIAAGPDNAQFYRDVTGGHTLLTIEFYEAIAGRSWCWFYRYAPDLLEDYRNFFPCWWPPLPEIPRGEYVNSEIFGLGLTRRAARLSDLTTRARLAELSEARGLDPIGTNAMDIASTWFCYDAGRWSSWDAISPFGETPFPAAGPVKPQYDYAGADAAVRIESDVARLTPGPEGASIANTIVWSAAAKPFGYLDGDVRPNACGLVLPAFRDVRLIPVDASSAPAGGGYNLGWREHIEEHLEDYMRSGPGRSSCWYCRQLLAWESAEFRRDGVGWLALNSALCTAQGPGGGPGGGTRRGH